MLCALVSFHCVCYFIVIYCMHFDCYSVLLEFWLTLHVLEIKGCYFFVSPVKPVCFSTQALSKWYLFSLFCFVVICHLVSEYCAKSDLIYPRSGFLTAIAWGYASPRPQILLLSVFCPLRIFTFRLISLSLLDGNEHSLNSSTIVSYIIGKFKSAVILVVARVWNPNHNIFFWKEQFGRWKPFL